ncbi:type I restriction endonuclease [Actinomycetaceae bacterium L2_0104]
MDFADALILLSKKVEEQWEGVVTEEGTKNAFIMPFISTVLGYDVFNPLEVIPEFTADVGIKKGEKVDYAIKAAGEIQILVECKKTSGILSADHASQLFRYFTVTSARVAILTNGRVYNFYTDLDEPNKMDSKPFLVLDLLDIDETILPELRKLAKANFDLDSIVSSAEELKYVGAMKREISKEFREPSLEFARLLTKRVYDGSFTQSVQEKFQPLVLKALSQYLTERVNERLKNALGVSEVLTEEEAIPVTVEPVDVRDEILGENNGIETTEEELFAFSIIKAIVCAEVAPERVVYRDAKSYFSVLLDDNNRRLIARCYFNAKSTRRIGIADEDKNIVRYDINDLQDIYHLSDQLREAVRRYL